MAEFMELRIGQAIPWRRDHVLIKSMDGKLSRLGSAAALEEGVLFVLHPSIPKGRCAYGFQSMADANNVSVIYIGV